jgi:hypothetical protein
MGSGQWLNEISVVLLTGCSVTPGNLDGFRQRLGAEHRKCEGPIAMRGM